MTKKDLFRIIIKLFGLYTLVGVLAALPEAIFSYFFGYDLTYAVVALITLIFLLMVLYILLVKTDAIIRLLKLDKGFDDERVEASQFSAESIVKLGLIIISLYFIIVSFPDILTNLFYIFKNSFPQNEMDGLTDLYFPTKVDYYVLTNATLKLFMGVILIMNKNKLARWVEKLN